MSTRIISTRRSAAVVLAALSVLLAGCGSGDSTGSAADPSEPPSTTGAETPAASTPAASSDLEGTWQAGPISLEDTEAHRAPPRARPVGQGLPGERPVLRRHRVDPHDRGRRRGTSTASPGVTGSRSRSTTTRSTRSTATPWSSTTPTARTPTAGRSTDDTLTPPVRRVDVARLPGDPGRGVPARAVHDGHVLEAGLTSGSTGAPLGPTTGGEPGRGVPCFSRSRQPRRRAANTHGAGS